MPVPAPRLNPPGTKECRNETAHRKAGALRGEPMAIPTPKAYLVGTVAMVCRIRLAIL